MDQYYELLREVITTGELRKDRTGTGTYAVFGRQMRFNLEDGFPLCTGKSVALRWIAAELLWMSEGSTNNERLRELTSRTGVKSQDDLVKELAKVEQCPIEISAAKLRLVSESFANGVTTVSDVEFLTSKGISIYYTPVENTIWEEWAVPEDVTIDSQTHKTREDIEAELVANHDLTADEIKNLLDRWLPKSGNKFSIDSDKYQRWLTSIGVDVYTPIKIVSVSRGELGPIYGRQWRNCTVVGPHGEITEVDQLADCIKLLKDDPYSRRIVLDSWQPGVLPDPKLSPQENARQGRQALPPCHYSLQLYVSFKDPEKPKLNLMYNMRSNDLFLGAPYNIAFYSLLVHLIANELGFGVGEVISSTGDTHVYSNHVDQVNMLLDRYDRGVPALPMLTLPPGMTLATATVQGIVDSLENYYPLGSISAPVAV